MPSIANDGQMTWAIAAPIAPMLNRRACECQPAPAVDDYVGDDEPSPHTAAPPELRQEHDTGQLGRGEYPRDWRRGEA
jgi:hypothetical protein